MVSQKYNLDVVISDLVFINVNKLILITNIFISQLPLLYSTSPLS